MNWSGILTIFFSATIKFMVAPIPGPSIFKMSFLETYFSACAGAICGTAFFYFAAEYLIIRAHKKKVQQRKIALEKKLPFVEKKKFTRRNRFVIRIKQRLGIIGISFWAPFFLSIPIGAVVVAKFYGKKKITFPLMCIGVFINGLVTTSIVYLF